MKNKYFILIAIFSFVFLGFCVVIFLIKDDIVTKILSIIGMCSSAGFSISLSLKLISKKISNNVDLKSDVSNKFDIGNNTQIGQIINITNNYPYQNTEQKYSFEDINKPDNK